MTELSPQIPATVVVGSAIQNLAAQRLGRGFVPLGLLCLVGLGEVLSGAGSGWLLALGAPLSAVAMVVFGMGVAQEAFGRPDRPWMKVGAVSSLLPPAFGLYVVGWRGLGAVAAWDGWGAGLGAVLIAALGAWALWAWFRLVELRRLAQAMTAEDVHSTDARP
jgi:hypothetical protein